MSAHLCVRLAWHDNGWNGTICQNPGANTYCCGSHSLLSDRIARDKRTSLEVIHPGKPLDSLMPGYLPPCYWSSAAFATKPVSVVHVHPFKNYRDSHQIPDQLLPSSVYTWPFRLSLTHSKEASKRDGKYPAGWDARADRYLQRLTTGTSFVFFYLNYDNPVSADEYKYALVGCARISAVARTSKFGFSPDDLTKLCKAKGMQNFGPSNWALKVSYDFADTGVRLPYQEYLAHIEQSPDDETKLEEIKVVVDEPALLLGVKYVSEQVGDDSCLYLLYKLRKAFEKVKEHGIASPGNSIARLDAYIEDAWKLRGLYPGLANVVGLLGALRDGDPDWQSADDAGIVASLREQLNDEEKLLTEMFTLLSGDEKPSYLTREQLKTLRHARRGMQQYGYLEKALRRLSLFDLTPRQLARILFPEVASGMGESHPFSGRSITAEAIANNPYLLCEEYVPATSVDKELLVDLDREIRSDGEIGYFTIDIGLFPDEDRYDCFDDRLQTLLPTGKERLRAFAVTTLKEFQDRGHTYASLQALVEAAQAYPLFYRSKLAINREHFLSPGHMAHFRERLHVEEVVEESYYYLRETKDAEDLIGRILQHLVSQSPRKEDLGWVNGHVRNEADALAKLVPDFPKEQFCNERYKLIEGVLTQRLFFVTGRPGSGKTRALREVVAKLTENKERVTLLAPTGKATLRVMKEAPDAQVETIDRWLSRSGLRQYAHNLASLGSMSRSPTYQPVENLIIDESSMVDLGRLAVVMRAIEVHEPDVRRVIFVGDENQLPPIGMGRPLHDILAFLHRDKALAERHIVRLCSNCRQRQDRTVIDAAYLFAGKNRYRTDLYQRLLVGGEISSHLHVEYWETPAELYNLINHHLDDLLRREGYLTAKPTPETREAALNLLFNLYENGYAKGYREKEENRLRIDALQLLSPYRGGFSGMLGLNQAIRDSYRAISYPEKTTYGGGYLSSAFAHSDKIIRITNHYAWVQDSEGNWATELQLSNGSIGIVCNNKTERRAVFPDTARDFSWSGMDEEDFEAAYAISVHKAQGSEFSEVFVVVPERRGLLSKELVYTAMTRSTGPMKLFVQRSPRENPLEIARERSELLRRNSSLLTIPVDARRVYEPEPGIRVQSKTEYLIYEALRAARNEGRLTFGYEQPMTLPLGGREIVVKPDFTIIIGDRRFFWEHLGMLDKTDYFNDWKERRIGYQQRGLLDQLVTSDDLNGIRAENLANTISAMISGKLIDTSDSPFSNHHYDLGEL
jgi:exodeoxyribonuclease V alpha subunit